MRIRFLPVYFILLMIFQSCSSDDNNSSDKKFMTFDFEEDTEGWTGSFSDYPVGEDDFYELEFTYSGLPSPLEEKGSLMLSGNNHSDDLFMFVKRKISGLAPSNNYRLRFEIEFATNIPDGMVGIGGSPGESVYIKAGATSAEPLRSIGNDGWYQMEIDKGNQAQGGSDMVVIGDFSNDSDQEEYRLKTVTNASPFIVTSNENGEIWAIIGTDSGFEGTTTIYISKISIEFY